MNDILLMRIATILENIDSRLESFSSDVNSQLNECLTELQLIRGAVDEMRMDVSGFEQNGSRVPGQLGLIVEAFDDLQSGIRSVEAAVQSVEAAVSSRS